MFFIFGSRFYYWTTGQGSFQCPKCQTTRTYKLRKGRRFVHLFYVPLIPISASREHVRCTSCKTRYVPDVLTQQAVA
jgi:predicted RNA-binding Zn-ribbon protein involved in translation (DUF1610 family)